MRFGALSSTVDGLRAQYQTTARVLNDILYSGNDWTSPNRMVTPDGEARRQSRIIKARERLGAIRAAVYALGGKIGDEPADTPISLYWDSLSFDQRREARRAYEAWEVANDGGHESITSASVFAFHRQAGTLPG